MGRLIDAEQLVTEMEINIGNIYNPDIITGMKFAIDLIKSRPTAYDVDAVVEQLERESIPIYDEDSETRVKVIGKNEAIDIVRKGGKE